MCRGHLRDKDILRLHLPINMKFVYININDIARMSNSNVPLYLSSKHKLPLTTFDKQGHMHEIWPFPPVLIVLPHDLI